MTDHDHVPAEYGPETDAMSRQSQRVTFSFNNWRLADLIIIASFIGTAFVAKYRLEAMERNQHEMVQRFEAALGRIADVDMRVREHVVVDDEHERVTDTRLNRLERRTGVDK